MASSRPVDTHTSRNSLEPARPPAPWEPAGPGLSHTLEAYRWRLDSGTDGEGRRIDAVAPSAARPFMLGFSGSRVLVEGGCNSMRGSYEIGADGRLMVGRMASTMRACEPALMQADAALARLLSGPLQVAMAKGGQPRLRLATAANDTLVLKVESEIVPRR